MNISLQFEQSLTAGNFRKSVFLGGKLYNENNFLFWGIMTRVSCEYLHICFPALPWFIYRKHKENSLHAAYQTIKTICQGYKQHISLYIPKDYNNIKKKVNEGLRVLFHQLNELFKKVIKFQAHIGKKRMQKYSDEIFIIISRLLSTGCDSLTNKDPIHGLILFTHTHSSISEKNLQVIWSIILTHAKQLDKDTCLQIVILHKFWVSKIVHASGKQSLLILQAVLYFVSICNFDFPEFPEVNENELIAFKKNMTCRVQQQMIETHLSSSESDENDDKKARGGKNKKTINIHSVEYQKMKRDLLNELDNESRKDIFFIGKLERMFKVELEKKPDEVTKRIINNLNKQTKKLKLKGFFNFNNLQKNYNNHTSTSTPGDHLTQEKIIENENNEQFQIFKANKNIKFKIVKN